MARLTKFFYQYCQTILEIIEDKPNFIIQRPIYCSMIAIFFFQIAGYIFSNYEIKPISDPPLSFVARIAEISPLTFLLFMLGNDFISTCFFIGMQAVIYGYFGYVALLTVKNNYQFQFTISQKIIRKINQILNVFFSFFWWLFFTPFIEINSGFIACGANSFLTAYRSDEACTHKPFFILIFAVLGLFLCFLTGVIVIFFFRNYQFDESNLLKRRYNSLLFI